MSVVRQPWKIKSHRLLGECAQDIEESDSGARYGLAHGAYHYAAIDDGEALWALSQSNTYQRQQYQVSRDFVWSYDTFRYSLAHYIKCQGMTAESDARLAWLVLRAGELAREAVEGVEVAFEWFRADESELDNALKRIEVLDEENYFKACLRLVMIEAWRQEKRAIENRNPDVPRKILEALDERIPDGTGTVEWSAFIDGSFMVDWSFLVIETWTNLDLGAVYRRGDSKAVCEIQTNLATRIYERGIVEESKEVFTQALTTANTISSETAKSETLVSIAKILSEQGMVEEALTTANTISSDSSKSEALASIAKCLSEQGLSSLLHQHLVKSSYSALLYESFLPNYQQALTDTPLLRASFLFVPFSYKLSQVSVYHFLYHHLRSEDKEYTHAIIAHCPQLELDFMLPGTLTVV